MNAIQNKVINTNLYKMQKCNKQRANTDSVEINVIYNKRIQQAASELGKKKQANLIGRKKKYKRTKFNHMEKQHLLKLEDHRLL